MPVIRIGASDGGTFSAYFARSPREAAPGVVVIQEIFGVNAGLQRTCDELAARGYTALAPDLFWRLEPDESLRGHSAERGSALRQQFDWPLAIEDLNTCVRFLREEPATAVATVGYCMGGRLAFMMAIAGESDCDVSVHGVGLEALVDGAPGLRHPVQVHIGGADHLCPPDAQEKIRSTLAGHPLAETFVYPDARHGFARPDSRNYDPVSAELAFERMLLFFSRHLHAEQRPRVTRD
jgi:carboxymethylenebutenolidase